MAFTHLHVHSHFSLLDGASEVESLVLRAAELGFGHLALTDHANLYGGVEFYKKCKEKGLKSVLGAGLWVQPEGIAYRDPAGALAGYHLVALVEDAAGYANLCELITRSIFDGMYYKPRVDLDLLRRHHEGLIFLTSGMRGPVRGLLARGRAPEARARLQDLAGILDSEHLFVELQDVGFDGDQEANEGAKALAAELGLQTVVTNAVHYLKPEDAPLLEVLHCIGGGASIHDEGRPRVLTDQLYMKSEAEMRELFPNDLDALERTTQIAERCHFKFTFGTYYFPASQPPVPGDTDVGWAFFYDAFPPPRDWGISERPPRPEGGGTLVGYFGWYAEEGLRFRLRRIPEDRHAEYWDRLQMELSCITKMGFSAYFLIVAEFINWAKDRAIPVGPGRGSAAGSLVAWSMRITDIDPIRFDLLFERFLNPERVSMPDVDVDFCQDRREEVIAHTREKYGRDFVSQIITYGKLQAKLAVRDVARICDLSFNDANAIAKLIPEELGIELDTALKEENLKALYEADGRVRRVFDLARRIEGLTRQTGVHAAGVVVADRPLVQLAPLYRDGPEGGPVVQYDMKSAEAVGLIKFDFLGLKTLDQLRDAVALVERNTGERIDLSDIAVDDEVTWKLLQRGDALGVFQVESSGMRDLLTRLRPSCLDDLVALVALYRPGPLEAGMVTDFIECKHGRKAVEYPHPQLESILRSTYGVVVYQEQVMQIAQVLSGYSLGEADLLRRAMGKKKPEEMAAQKGRFVSGAEKNGVPTKKADDIFELLAKFAAYGFNKSHSAAYGYVSYQTAWLKANHRAEYMAALLSIEAGNTDKILIYIEDCKRAGLKVLPPDVNESQARFDVPRADRTVIRYGLEALKGVGAGAVEAILEARKAAGGRFKDLGDMLERLDFKRVNRKVLESLVKCGALDWTGMARSAMLEGLDAAVSSAQREQEDRAAGQFSLFGGAGAKRSPFRLPDVPEFSLGKRLELEREAVGFYLSGNPIEAFAEEAKRLATCKINAVQTLNHERAVTVCGMPTSVRVVKTKRGDKMAFVQLSDETGSLEVVFFPEGYARSARALGEDAPVLIQGTVERTDEGAKIQAESAELMSEVRERRTREVHLHIKHEELGKRRVEALLRLLQRSTGPCPVWLHVVRESRAEVVMALPPGLTVLPDERLFDGVAEVFRRRDVVRLT